MPHSIALVIFYSMKCIGFPCLLSIDTLGTQVSQRVSLLKLKPCGMAGGAVPGIRRLSGSFLQALLHSEDCARHERNAALCSPGSPRVRCRVANIKRGSEAGNRGRHKPPCPQSVVSGLNLFESWRSTGCVWEMLHSVRGAFTDFRSILRAGITRPLPPRNPAMTGFLIVVSWSRRRSCGEVGPRPNPAGRPLQTQSWR